MATTTTIVIPAGRRHYTISKATLCQRSNYFKAAYQAGMKEAKENCFTFTDDEIDVEAFDVFINWIQTGKIEMNGVDEEVDYEYIEDDDMDLEELGPGAMLQITKAQLANFPFSERLMARAKLLQQQVELLNEKEELLKETVEVLQELVDLRKGSSGETLGNEYGASAALMLGRPEQDYFLAVAPWATRDTKASDLHGYQLEALIDLAVLHGTGAEYHDRWWDVLPDIENDQDILLHEKDFHTAEHQENLADSLTDLYILADRFDTPDLRHQIMNLLLDQPDNTLLPSSETISKAFDDLPPTSKFRLWLIHVFAYEWDPAKDTPEQKAEQEDLPPEFLVEVMRLNALQLREQEDDEEEQKTKETKLVLDEWCVYHEHEMWEEVVKCREMRGEESYEDENGNDEYLPLGVWEVEEQEKGDGDLVMVGDGNLDEDDDVEGDEDMDDEDEDEEFGDEDGDEDMDDRVDDDEEEWT